MIPLEAVLFDLDGTLIDTAPDFAVAVNQLRQRHDQPPLAYADIRATVSHGARALVTLALKLKEGDHHFEARRQELLDLYEQHLAVDTCLFPGMKELLDHLEQQKLPWGIVTNKPRRYAEPILAALKLNERCASLVCPDDVSRTKPDPEPMLLACQQIQCAPTRTLYLGDHRRDIEAGKNAAMKTLAVNYGYIEAHDPADSWQADFYVDHANEIMAVLNRHFKY
ncbi:HAD-IA family hydrolase [Oceanicoccus sp. KOV_DT_Chl]|uniref:HAD-IA family hydrolase n=1 Tax=Oceanicoccus sp. KOV_DT_Chl TaxID=1904639 RepID=UPI000C798B3F|nr:HAD-IA family hydrolase [Oceanicoccus sp. KOV_DT_Chl]